MVTKLLEMTQEKIGLGVFTQVYEAFPPRSGLLEPANEPDKQPRSKFFVFVRESFAVVACRQAMRFTSTVGITAPGICFKTATNSS